MNIMHGRISGEDLQSSDFYNTIKECKTLYIIDGNFSFVKFKILQNQGIKLDDFEEIKIIISAGRNLNLVNLFEDFFTYSTEEKKDILEEAFLGTIKSIDVKLVQEIYDKILQNKIQIKLGFTKDSEPFMNDEVIFGNKYTLIGGFDRTDFFIPYEYYYVLNKKEVIASKKNFSHKFNKSFPFTTEERTLNSKKSISATSNYNLGNIFNFKEFINEVFEDRLGIKRNIQKESIKISDDLETFNDKDNPFIFDEINEENVNNRKLRDYQEEAINELVINNFNGKIQMATGTGKTFTTLYGLKDYLKNEEKTNNITLIVPLKQLVNQWEEEIKKVFGSNDIFAKDQFKIYKCYSEEKEWRQELEHYVGTNQEYKYNFIIFVDDSFGEYIKEDENINILKSKNSLLIVDEAHNLTKQVLSILINNNIFQSTLALSATLYDEDDIRKNKMLDTYFKGVNFSYTIDRAIKSGYLCEYKYFPTIVDLNSDEVQKYKEIKNKLNKLKEAEQFDEKYLSLKKEEGNLISKAHRKMEFFEKDLERLDDKNNILVYSNPGNYSEVKYIDYISNLIKTKAKVKVEQIIASTPLKQRNEIIKKFENNEVKVIAAINCLDEGIDIPSIKRAYLLYSGGKSKEYIQRRGRILRKHKNKEVAHIHDYIVRVDGEFPQREIKRFNEYVLVAQNAEELKTFLGE